MGLALSSQQVFEQTSCCVCGIVFVVPQEWNATKRRDRTSFYCPNGHSLSYTQNIVEALKQQIAGLESSLTFEKARTVNLDRKLKTESAKHARLKKRIAAGVCPCCKRTVRQLVAHMRTQHPDYTAASEAASCIVRTAAAG